MSNIVATILDTTLGDGMYKMTLGAVPLVSESFGTMGGHAGVVASNVVSLTSSMFSLGWSVAVLGASVMTNPYVIGAGTVLAVGGHLLSATPKIQNLFNWSTAFKNTTDLTEQAHNGKLPRAYGRDKAVNQLNEALEDPGFAILVGKSGVGKSALVEELACRIDEGKVGNLNGARLIRLNLRDAEGGVGLTAVFNDMLFGGLEKYIRNLLVALERSNGSGQKCILFIDEIQDLLRQNPTIFDPFKEELARGRLKIIGATTDGEIIDQLRRRQGTGAGLLRRIEVINVDPMTDEEAVEVVEAQAAALANGYKGQGLELKFDDNFYEAVVLLSKELFIGIQLPNRASSLLTKIALHAFNNRGEEDKMTLNADAVVGYVAQRSGKRVETVRKTLESAQAVQLHSATFQESFFPEVIPLKKPTTYLADQSPRLDPLNNPESPWIALSGDCNELQMDVVANWAKGRRSVYRCDLMKLAHLANTQDGKQYLKSTLEQVFRTGPDAPVLVLENCKSGWVTSSGTKPSADPVSVVQDIASSPMGVAAQKMASKFGIDTTQMTSAIGAPTSNPDEVVPDVVKQLISFVHDKKVPTVMIGNPPQTLFGSSRTLTPLKLDETIEWLNVRYQTLQARANKAVTTDNPWIATLVFSLYQLKGFSRPESPLDIVEKVITLAAVKGSDNIQDHLRTVLEGTKTPSQIQQVFELAERQKETLAFDEIQHEPSSVCPNGLRSQLHKLTSSPNSSVLWVTEDSTVRRQGLMDQMAAGLHKVHQTCTHLNYQLIKGMPKDLKVLVLEKSLPALNKATVVMMEEEALKDEEVLAVLRAGSYKVVCFKSVKKQTGADAPSTSFVGSIFRQGLDAVAATFGQMVKVASNETQLFGHEFEYIPSDLSSGEIRRLLIRRLETTGEASLPLQNLYLHLARQPNVPLDQVFDRLSKDLDLYQSKTIEQICAQFKELYETELGMSLNSVKYTADPALTSKGYRAFRATTSTISTTASIVTYPLRKGAWVLGAALTGVTGFFFTTIIRWVRGRISPF